MNTQTQSAAAAAFHPMQVLREALYSGLYSRSPNGQPNTGDRLALLLGHYDGPTVVAICCSTLALPSNPYVHLNIGQQSMNLRNRLRAALKRGDFGWGVVDEAIEDVTKGGE